jgi:hypothetical protein
LSISGVVVLESFAKPVKAVSFYPRTIHIGTDGSDFNFRTFLDYLKLIGGKFPEANGEF